MHYGDIQGNSNYVDMSIHIYNRLSAYIKDAFYSQIDTSVILSLLLTLDRMKFMSICVIRWHNKVAQR